jgi:hypothetical protein
MNRRRLPAASFRHSRAGAPLPLRQVPEFRPTPAGEHAVGAAGRGSRYPGLTSTTRISVARLGPPGNTNGDDARCSVSWSDDTLKPDALLDYVRVGGRLAPLVEPHPL